MQGGERRRFLAKAGSHFSLFPSAPLPELGWRTRKATTTASAGNILKPPWIMIYCLHIFHHVEHNDPKVQLNLKRNYNRWCFLQRGDLTGSSTLPLTRLLELTAVHRVRRPSTGIDSISITSGTGRLNMMKRASETDLQWV